nr:unnamed protein product [Callosobruchus chinensis]CAH7752230.1 unnamed protein product [Callosobruchus chinensis]
MELFSKNFMKAVMAIVKNKNLKVIATVPVKSNCSSVMQLKEDKEFELITVTATNRNDLEEVILKKLV